MVGNPDRVPLAYSQSASTAELDSLRAGVSHEQGRTGFGAGKFAEISADGRR
jgi:hypothetical protein